MESLENYQPKDVEYILSDEVREEFPLELRFNDCETKKDVMRFVGKNFTVTFPDGEYVTRKMDDHEKAVLRKEYCSLVENVLPERKRMKEEAYEESKRIKKEADEAFSSTLQEISGIAAEVKQGTVETRLKGTDTFCIALAGYYLYYTWNGEAMVLAKATRIEDSSLWSQDDKNREMMRELFGMEFPEAETETDDNADF